MRLEPGSETIGDPASEIREIIFPELISFSMCLCFFSKSWSVYFSIIGALILKCLSKLRLCLVFSQRITSEFFKTLIALNVISSKLPMGVATKYKPNFIKD